MVIIPAQNAKDFSEVPAELRKNLKVKTVEHIDEVWPLVCLEPSKEEACQAVNE
jgi:ATP-dependent Lon protease